MRRTEPTHELPTLDDRIHHLVVNKRPKEVLQSLVIDHLLGRGASSKAIWIDSHGNGSTHPLAGIAPISRLLDRIEVARGFTAHQHYALLEELEAAVTANTELVVLPELDWFYRNDDLYDCEGERMFSAAVDLVQDLQHQTGIPVLVTARKRDRISDSLYTAVEERLLCQFTNQGPRFSGEGFETYTYPVENGLLQTTIAYWNQMLADTQQAVGESGPTPEVSALGAY